MNGLGFKGRWALLFASNSLVLAMGFSAYGSPLPVAQRIEQQTPLMETQEIPLSSRDVPLSPGDRIRISVSEPNLSLQGTEAEPFSFSGLYEVNLDRTIELPFIRPIPVDNFGAATLELVVKNKLIEAGMFQPSYLQVSAEVVEWAPVQVTVKGAVFTPGQILADRTRPRDILRLADEPTPERFNEPFVVSGNYPPSRFLTAALLKAGGVKPNADLQNVKLVRNGQETKVNILGVVTGEPVQDLPIVAGDQIIIPSLDDLQPNLVRPSTVTPAVIGVFISNQAEPQGGGRTGGQLTEFAYGTRFSQGAIAATCAGGTSTTNANRRISLIQTDPMTGTTTVYDRKVEELIREPNAIPEGNPYLMPLDTMVCYDSEVTNTAGIFDFLNTILNPFEAIFNIFDTNN